ncbi:glutamate receptor ionotropic, delta-1-like [Schistocerca americana]|uniref:glutamate receptor ionotropic, delta-1-like n=1 Tax=Schistocerca americana TaxID=7009 RepID=UPI001F4F1346|nr:glutamate receptor ionotropic, delta-1-like [Schistocerca americana]
MVAWCDVMRVGEAVDNVMGVLERGEADHLRGGIKGGNRGASTVTEGGDSVVSDVPVGTSSVRLSGALEQRLLVFTLDADCLGAVVRFDLISVRFTGRLTWRDEVVLGSWERGRGLLPPSADLFPDKLSDLQGREFVFGTFHYPPYVVLDDKDPTFQDGLEARMILEFLKKVNATCRLTLETEDKWGQIWDNGSGNGLMGAVVRDLVDASYSSLGYWYYEHIWLDYSRSYYRTGITCLAPRPRPLPGWQVPLLPFSAYLWAAVGVSVLVATAALFIAKTSSTWLLGEENDTVLAGGRYSTVEDCFFRSLGLLVLQTPDVERRHTRVVGPTRHVLSWLLIAYLLVTASYGSGLSSVLTIPRYEPPINTVRDLRDSGLNWAATHIAWLNPLRGTDEQVIIDLCERFRALKEEDMKARSSTRDLALGIERLPAGYFAVGDYIEEEAASKWLRPMREDIYWEMNNIMVRKGWPHLQHLDDLIDRLIDSGLILAWEGQVTRRWLAPRVQLAVQTAFRLPSAGAEPVKLGLSHVQGEFALLALGLCLSLLALLAELAIHRFLSGGDAALPFNVNFLAEPPRKEMAITRVCGPQLRKAKRSGPVVGGLRMAGRKRRS